VVIATPNKLFGELCMPGRNLAWRYQTTFDIASKIRALQNGAREHMHFHVLA
jgi:hypothetical protein